MDSLERIRGWVVSWDDLKNYGVVSDHEHCRKFVAVGSEVQPDKIGRRYLVPGEDVLFSVGIGDRKADRALNVRPISRPLLETYPADYTEECAVESYDQERGFGFLKRPLGGYLFLHRSNIVTIGEETLKAGSLVWCRPLPQEGQNWLAGEVQILEPVPESAEPETAMAAALSEAGF